MSAIGAATDEATARRCEAARRFSEWCRSGSGQTHAARWGVLLRRYLQLRACCTATDTSACIARVVPRAARPLAQHYANYAAREYAVLGGARIPMPLRPDCPVCAGGRPSA